MKKRYFNQFSPCDLKGIASSYKHVHESLTEDLEEMGIDELISDYIKEKDSEEMKKNGTLYLDPGTRVIQSIWNTGDNRIGIRFVPGSEEIRFATPDEMIKIFGGDSVCIFINISDLEKFYRANGYDPGSTETSDGVFWR